ncbi:MAG: OmpA family protein [Bdellovibrionales bacterium]|nr:OmpA family protein [Bdellovibrionales bacterium]
MTKKILLIGLIAFFTFPVFGYNVTVDPTIYGFREGLYGPKKKSLTTSLSIGQYWNGVSQNLPQGVSRFSDTWRYILGVGYQLDENFGLQTHLGFTPTRNNNNEIYSYDMGITGSYDLEIFKHLYLYGALGPGFIYVKTPNIDAISRFAIHTSAGAKVFAFKNLAITLELSAITSFDSLNAAFAPSVGVKYYFQSTRNRLDQDGDGIKNDLDKCINEPETYNGFEDQDGCPEDPNDLDGDGIPNDKDKCPKDKETVNGALDDDGCPENPNDWDEDGILNEQDQCPKDPETKNGFEDEDGCPENTADWDRDGIPNDQDLCPQDPETKNGYKDEDGCPEDPNDWDADGFQNDKDKCPKEPETINGLDDTDGCPDHVPGDSDDDGVRDDLDKCPGAKEVYNGYKDDDGCPDHELDEFSGVVEGIHFNLGKSTILIDSYAKLNKGAELFQKYPTLKFIIEGHTDSTGSMQRNMELSKERAESVRSYLSNRGIDSSRMSVEAYGPSKPIADNASDEGRARNRRIEFKLLNLEEVKKSGQ